MNIVHRPEPKKQKINTKDNFELCYLRHQYIRKSTHNPTEAEIEPYLGIIVNQARKTTLTNYYLLSAVGLSLDDVINIGRMHTVSFLNLFTMEAMPKKMEQFVLAHIKKKNREPDFADILDKNKANFTQFMKQRYEDLIRICRQKSRNIEGVAPEDFIAFSGKNPPRYLHRLLKEYPSLGFRKLDPAVFRTIKKRARPDNPDFFEYQGDWYVVVRMERAKLTLENIVASELNPFNSEHMNDPEEVLVKRQDEREFETHKERFSNMTPADKAQMIKDFINKKAGDITFSSELRVARRLLKTME